MAHAGWGRSSTFIDLHYPEAVRMLDFAHAAEYLTAIAQTPGPTGPLLAPEELGQLRHALKLDGPDAVLSRLRMLVASQPTNTVLASQVAYLETRRAQLQYPQFVADGWPIGSGIVESANKLVVEDRLKGAGMHWAAANVNPILALRNAVCNDRWDEVWTVIECAQHREVTVRRHGRRTQRATATAPEIVTRPAPDPLPAYDLPVQPVAPETKPVHPWKHAWSKRRQRELAGAA